MLKRKHCLEVKAGEVTDISKLTQLFNKFKDEDVPQLKEANIPYDNNYVQKLVAFYIENHVSYGLWHKDELVGGIIGYIAPFIYQPHMNTFYEILWYIEKDYRRYSIRFLKDFEAYLLSSYEVDIIEMYNFSNISNPVAKRMYERSGYTLLSQRFVKDARTHETDKHGC